MIEGTYAYNMQSYEDQIAKLTTSNYIDIYDYKQQFSYDVAHIILKVVAVQNDKVSFIQVNNSDNSKPYKILPFSVKSQFKAGLVGTDTITFTHEQLKLGINRAKRSQIPTSLGYDFMGTGKSYCIHAIGNIKGTMLKDDTYDREYHLVLNNLGDPLDLIAIQNLDEDAVPWETALPMYVATDSFGYESFVLNKTVTSSDPINVRLVFKDTLNTTYKVHLKEYDWGMAIENEF